MKKYLVAGLALALLSTAAQAQLPPEYIGRTGRVTQEVCVTPVVTAGAYVAGNIVGGLITMPSAFLIANSGTLQSIRLTFKSVQTLEFDVTFFASLPTTVFTDHAAGAIVAADALRAQPAIKLVNNYSGLGTHTVYGADNINRGYDGTSSSAYAVVVSVGTPTLASVSDMQLCATIIQD